MSLVERFCTPLDGYCRPIFCRAHGLPRRSVPRQVRALGRHGEELLAGQSAASPDRLHSPRWRRSVGVLKRPSRPRSAGKPVGDLVPAVHPRAVRDRPSRPDALHPGPLPLRVRGKRMSASSRHPRFDLPAYGFSPLRRWMRIGVPGRSKASRRPFSR